MNTGTGVVGIILALGALVVSSASSKTAEARSSKTTTSAVAAQPASMLVATTTTPAVAPLLADVQGATEVVTPPRLLQDRGLRRLQKSEVSPAMLHLAADVVRRHYAQPVGTEVAVDVDGKHVVARIERHFHPEGGPVKPWGFHPGVSLFIAR